MGLGGWLRLLARQRFRIGPRYIPAALVTTLHAPLNSMLGLVQKAIYRQRIAAVQLDPPPVFILGHWRCGTTLLHELLALHPAHSAPSNVQCLLPSHFLLTERWARLLLARVLPEQRVMDPMRLGADSPQEDEFALCNLGLPSPYLWIAFPNGGYDRNWEALTGLPDKCVLRWKTSYLAFLKSVALARPGRLVIKNPLHSFRIPILEELFPGARYIHITRHPAETFSSSMRMWRALRAHHGYQTADDAGLERHVLETGLRLYGAIAEGRASVSDDRWCETRYEDLVAHPHEVLAHIHDKLQLADCALAASARASYLSDRTGYRAQTRVTAEEFSKARAHWPTLFEHGGYNIGD
jgi:hypothetical protein